MKYDKMTFKRFLQIFMIDIDQKLYLNMLTPLTDADFHEGRAKKYTERNFKFIYKLI